MTVISLKAVFSVAQSVNALDSNLGVVVENFTPVLLLSLWFFKNAHFSEMLENLKL